MKVTCQRDSLQTACRLVSAAVPAHATVPALKNFKASALDDRLTLVAYDPTQGVGIRYTLEGVAVARSGACILPKDQLLAILAESPDPAITLDAGKEAVVARCGETGGRFEMLSMDVNDYPDIPAFDDGGNRHEISAGALRHLIGRTAFAADRKDTTARFQLHGVLWEADGAEVRLVATDTKRLALCRGPAVAHGAGSAADRGATSLVPLKAVHLVEKNLADDAEVVRVALRANDALFLTRSAMIYTSLLSGKFPPHEKLFEKTRKEATQRVELPVAALLAKVRQAAIMSDDESKRVDVVFEPGKVTLTASGPRYGSSEVVLDLPDHTGPRTELAFDPQYLTEFLRSVEGEEAVTLHMHDGTKAVLFRAGATTEHLVMPLSG